MNLIIAMDLSFNPEDHQVLKLRQHPVNLDELAPVIRLVTINSAEHVRLCLPAPSEIPTDRHRLQGIIAATTILRNFNGVGISNDEARYRLLVEYIRSKDERHAEVFGIRDIEGYLSGHRGMAGLALKRVRPDDTEGGVPKRIKSATHLWQVSSSHTVADESNPPTNLFNVKMMNFMKPLREGKS